MHLWVELRGLHPWKPCQVPSARTKQLFLLLTVESIGISAELRDPLKTYNWSVKASEVLLENISEQTASKRTRQLTCQR